MKKSQNTPFGHEQYAIQAAINVKNPATHFLQQIDSLRDEEKQALLCQLDDSFIIDLLADVETLDKSLRSSLSSDLFDDVTHIDDLKKLWSDVEIYPHDTAEFIVCMPPVVACSYRKGEYGLANRVRFALRDWFKTQQKPPYRPDDPLIFAYKRYITSLTRQICDNDNMEFKRITNAIVSAFGCSDKATTVFFQYYSYVSEVKGVELIVFRRSKWYEMSPDLLADKPLHPSSSCFSR